MKTRESVSPWRQRVALLGWRTDGAQLLEFALVMPFLVVLAIGAFDFGAGFLLKQKLTNAAREGARISIQLSTIDLTTTNCPTTGASAPCTVDAVRDAVVAYLQEANLDTSFIAENPTKTGATEWTYASTASGQPIIVINRQFPVADPDGALILTARVVVTYPYAWSFDRIAKLLSSSASFASSMLISGEAIMKNLG